MSHVLPLLIAAILAAGQTAPLEVYLKTDFDTGDMAFQADGRASVGFDETSGVALVGRSLRIARSEPGSYFGARMAGLELGGSAGLRVAFLLRTRDMRTVAVNLFDDARQDNATPASPARTVDDEWRPAVLHVEDFHYNSEEPDRKLRGGERFSSVMFHGREEGEAPEIWIDKLVVYRGPDTTPPEPPAGLSAVPGDGGVVGLRWTEPADDTFAVVYSVHRQAATGGWAKIAESLQPAYRDVVPAAGSYRYRVTAADYDHNVSAPSAEVMVTTAEGRPADPPDQVVQDRLGYADHVREVHEKGRGTVRPGVVLFAGDSITGALVYTHILGSWIGRGQTIRQGVASVTTAYGSQNIREYLRNGRPEFAVVMYGTNDRKGGRDVDAAMRSLADVIDACVEAGTVPIMATIPPRDYGRRQGEQERFNEALIALAREHRVPVSYVFEEMMQHDLRQVLYDGIHLTPEFGNDVAGRALRRTMDQVWFVLR